MKPHAILVLIASAIAASCCSTERTAAHFNALAVDHSARPDEVVRSLGITPGMAIADIGAGGGYFAFRFAKETGASGVVYAVDIDQGLLDYIARTAERERVRTVVTVRAQPDDPGLPAGGVNLVFVRNVFHHITEPGRYFKKIAGSLRPGGRVAIIDYRPGHLRTLFHSVPEEKIVAAMHEAGFRSVKRHTFLERQSFNIFIRE